MPTSEPFREIAPRIKDQKRYSEYDKEKRQGRGGGQRGFIILPSGINRLATK